MKYAKILFIISVVATFGAKPQEEAKPKTEAKPIQEVTVKKVEPIKFVSIARQGDYSQVGAVFEELYKWLTAKKVKPAGSPFGIFYDNPKEMPPERCRYEGCVPIEKR